MQPQLPDFRSFLCEQHRDYVIDENNENIIHQLGLWALRSPEFETQGRYLSKGILLIGNVGSGKTELMRMLRMYLAYLKSPYAYKMQVVWKFAELFSERGYACFQNQTEGDMYYDELCLTDERAGIPVKEYASYYGTKILIGTELVMSRYNLFKQTAYQSHFTTNETPEALQRIYGERVYSRLTEMCNFFTMINRDRRETINPTFHADLHQTQTVKPRPVSEEEVLENKKRLNADYQAYLQDGRLSELASIDFPLFALYGRPVATEDQMQEIMQRIRETRKEQVMTNAEDVGSALRVMTLRKQYSGSVLDKEEKDFVWERTRQEAIRLFFERLKSAGEKEVFPITN